MRPTRSCSSGTACSARWGLSIIFLTFTIRLAILPLTFKGVKSMQRLQALQPEMKRLQERYKDDKQRMNQELMKFYQEQKVNPLGSCLPLLLQIPFFMALFYLLGPKATARSQGDTSRARTRAFLFIPDLAEKLTDNLPVLAVMVVLYIGTQLASTAVTAISADPTQRKIMFALPFVFTLFVINFPAGLLLYWITTNTWTIGQQLLVRKLYPKPEPIEALRRRQTRARAREAAAPRRPRPGGDNGDGRQGGQAAGHPQAGQGREGHRRRERRAQGRAPVGEPRPPSRRPRRARSASGPGAGASGSLARDSRRRRPRTGSATWSPRSATASGSRGSASSSRRTTKSCRPRSTARTSAC